MWHTRLLEVGCGFELHFLYHLFGNPVSLFVVRPARVVRDAELDASSLDLAAPVTVEASYIDFSCEFA